MKYKTYSNKEIIHGNEHYPNAATVFTPNITIGLTDWWNITFSQVIGRRVMTWDVKDNTSLAS